MKKGLLLLIFGTLCPLLLLNSCRKTEALSEEQFSSMISEFRIPSDDNRVWTYYYWYNDNVSKKGITKDLEAMKKAGIGTVFIGNINWMGKDGNVPVLSEEWWDCMVHTVNEGHRLGIDIGMFNSPGWSQSGGPWVKPEMAMRYLSFSETTFSGPGQVEVQLEKPNDEFQDTHTLAFRAPEAEQRDLRSLCKDIYSNPGLANTGDLIDNQQESAVLFYKYTDELSFEFQLSEPITARQFTIAPASAIKCNCELYALVEGGEQLVSEFVFDRSLLFINGGPNVGPIVYGELAVSLPGTRSDHFRLLCKDIEVYEVYEEADSEIGFSEINISEAPVLDHYIEKQLGKMHPTDKVNWDSYLWEMQEAIDDRELVVNDVIDISDRVDAHGNLVWDVPEGAWTILRMGMTPTGTTNLPAAPRGKGYEVDKMNREHLETHFDHFVGEMIRRIPEESKPAFKYAIMDSYETGSQNWTDGYEVKFREKYGYDPVKYLPVLSGRIVGSVEESERFLWDLRRAIADDIAYEYVAGLREISHRYRLETWLENYGHWGFPSEFMMYGGQSDQIGGEFWNEGTLGNIECKAASSTSHVYGKGRTSAEAFTAMKYPYLRHPSRLKKRGDWAFTEGINHFVFHVYIHQPFEDRVPGMDAWFSTEFNRNNTWFGQLHHYTDYIRRAQHLLQQGQYVADVCYFIGEDTPIMTGRPWPEMPKGYSFDYINAEVILKRLEMKDGRFTLPDGMSYKVMVLPQLKTMRPEVLAKLEQLVKQGGVILGQRPERSPSLQNYPQCDAQVETLASRLWDGDYVDGKMIHRYGNGMVLDGNDIESVLAQSQVEKDVDAGDAPVLWTHRSMPGMEIYFITNQGDDEIEIEPSFRVTGLKPQLWDAVSGEIRHLGNYSDERGRTTVPLKMEGQRSWFVVFTNNGDAAIEPAAETNFPEFELLTGVEGPFDVDFVNKKLGPHETRPMETLTDLAQSPEEEIRFYSGCIVYNTSFHLDEVPEVGDLYINLGKVAVMAEVKLNGKSAGGVWDAPYRLKITELVQQGENRLEVEVANLWQNRLIRDQQLPEEERLTWTSEEHEFEDKEPHASGLLGPVRIEVVMHN
ncbi:MAG: glycosyl hydrolase [Bacteroidota bacterium]